MYKVIVYSTAIAFIMIAVLAGFAYAADCVPTPAPSCNPCPTATPCPTTPACGPCPPAPCLDKWHYTITPYVWLTSISGDVAARGRQAHVDVGVGDIIDKLNWITEFHAEARKGKLGFYVDPSYVKLSVGGADQNGNPASVGFREWLIDFALTYRLLEKQSCNGGSQSVDFIAGGRYWNLNTDITIQTIGSGSATKSWVDPIVGLRYTGDLSPRWTFALQGDIGGFGASSEFTWSVAPVFIYHISESGSLVLGYRALGVDYSTGSGDNLFKLDTTYHGPLMGYAFSF